MEYRILGPLQVLEAGQTIALAGAKQRALLAILLLHANETVSRDRLIDELWGDEPPETAKTALQVHVSQVRKALGSDAIVTRAPGYMVQVGEGQLDADRFEQLVDAARGKPGAEAAEELREALALWRGPLLADLDDSVARAERARLEEQRLAALEQRVDADLALGRHADLVPELEGLVQEHPLRERLRGQLMLALYRSGRQADALEIYRAGRKLLDEELGLEPGEELRQLEKAILTQDPSIAAPPPSLPARLVESAGRRRWLLTGAGALLLAGAIAAAAIELTSSGSSTVTVAPNSVAVVDPKSGKTVADVPIGGRPVAIAVGQDAVWVADADDGTVSRIDPKSRKVVKTIGLGADVNDVAVGFGSVWVAGGNDETLTRINPRRNAVEATLRFGKADPLRPKPVFFVAVGRKAVWITRGNDVLRIDPATNQATARVSCHVPCGFPGTGDGSVWVTTGNEHLLRIDEGSGKLTANETLPSFGGPSPVVTRGALWLIVYTQTPQVWQLDPGDLTQTATVPFRSGFPVALTAGQGSLWLADHGGRVLWRIDPATARAKPVVRVGYYPIAIAVGDGAVWVGVQQRHFR